MAELAWDELMTVPDRPHEACGVFGIYAPGADVARITFFALYALQHRGQESAGIATSDGRAAYLHKDMGLVAQVFNEENLQPAAGPPGHRPHSLFDQRLVPHPQCAAPSDRDHARPAGGGAQRQPDQCPYAAPAAAGARRRA